MSESTHEATTPRRSLNENLQETVDILRHSNISLSKAILIAVVAVAAAAVVL